MYRKQNNHVTVKMNGQQFGTKPPQIKVVELVAKPVAKPEEPLDRSVVFTPPGKEDPEQAHDNDAMERLMQLRHSENQPAKAETEKLEPLYFHKPFSFLLNEEKDRTEYVRSVSFTKTPLFKSLVAMFSAVTVGFVFGFLVLTVFTQEHLSQSYRTVLNGTMQTLTATQTDEPIPNAPTTSVPSTTASQTQQGSVQATLHLPEQRFLVAQAGAFQASTLPDEAIAPIKQQGYPHLLYKADDKLYLFVATAPTRDEILGFASGLKNKGIDVYVKEVAFPSLEKNITLTQTTPTVRQADMQSFFLTGVEMARSLSTYSSQIVNNAEKTVPNEESLAALKEKHRHFLEESRALQTPPEWESYFTGMVNGLDQSMIAQTKLTEAITQKKPENAESYAWQIQSGVLTYLENYANWLQFVK